MYRMSIISMPQMSLKTEQTTITDTTPEHIENYMKDCMDQWMDFRVSFHGINASIEMMMGMFQQLHTEYVRIKDVHVKEMNKMKETVSELTTKIDKIDSEYTATKDELANLKKVSIYTHVTKKLEEQNNYIKILEKRLERVHEPVAIPQLTVQSPVAKDVAKDVAIKLHIEKIHLEPEPACEIDERIHGKIGNVEEIEKESDDDTEDVEEEQEDDEVGEEEQEDDEEEGEEETEDVEEEEEQEDEETEDVEEEGEEEEPEIEYESRKIGKKYYYISNEEPVGIYKVIKETGEVGDKVGEYDENNKPTFYE